MERRPWSRDELLAAFNLYCRTPFGRLHRSNPDIVTLAARLGRSPSAVAMKLSNFASIDPAHRARNVHGLSNASRADKAIWDEFSANPEQVAFLSERSMHGLILGARPRRTGDPAGPTEVVRSIRSRLVQGFFRDAVLASYESQCAMCDIHLAELLTACHIIPWSKSIQRRADPRNGLALCALHDRAFDRGLLTVGSDLRILLSGRLKVKLAGRMHRLALLELEHKELRMPHRFFPDPDALTYHRDTIFVA